MKIKSIINCELQLEKLINYGHLPSRMIFFLSTIQPEIQNSLDSYHNARNLTLAKYGKSEDGINYMVPAGKNMEAYNREIQELLNQECDIEFPPERITLCPESIDKAEIGLNPEKRLGFTAKDWLAIQEVIKVVETEE